MKTKSKAVVKQARKRDSPEFKQQALARAGQDGVAITAKALGFPDASR